MFDAAVLWTLSSEWATGAIEKLELALKVRVTRKLHGAAACAQRGRGVRVLKLAPPCSGCEFEVPAGHRARPVRASALKVRAWCKTHGAAACAQRGRGDGF